MDSGNARIRVKLGQMEIEYEGNANFVTNGLLDTLKAVLELHKHHPTALAPLDTTAGGATKIDHSTDTIATLLQAKSGPDLVVAAAAHLHFAKDKSQFTRQEIISEMRTAPAYFKETFVNNMSGYLSTLTKADRLRLVAVDTYSLPNKEKQEIGAKLAAGQ